MIAAHRAHKACAQLRQCFRRRQRCRIGDEHRIDLESALVENRLQDRLFVFEVAIERAEPEVGSLRDVRDRRRIESARRKKTTRRTDEGLAIARALPFDART